MRQKLAIARALLHHPQLVFLDEPTSGLDPVAAAAFHDDLKALTAREGVTVFLTTHNLAEAEKLCQQIGIIRKGELIAVGSPDELKARRRSSEINILGSGFTEALLNSLRIRPEVLKVKTAGNRLFMELNNTAGTAPLISLIVASGGKVEEVHRNNISLEGLFMALMKEKE